MEAITNACDVLRLEKVDTAAVMRDSSNHSSIEGDKKSSASVNEPLRLAAYSAQTDGTLMGRVTDGAELRSSDGESEELQRVIDILQSTAVEFPEGHQFSNFHHTPLLEYLHWLKNSLLLRLTTRTATESAMMGDRRLEGSNVVVNNGGLGLKQDGENGNVTKEAIQGKDPSCSYQYQDNDNQPDCRICQMSSKTDDVIDLGCACKLDMGRVHGVCAVTWFQFRGTRQCEICGEIAMNVYIPEEIMDKGALNSQDTVITGNEHHVDYESRMASTGRYLFIYRKHILWIAFIAVFVTVCCLYSYKHFKGRNP